MTYEKSKDPNKDRFPGISNAAGHGPARNWYSLQSGDIGTKELPVYGRSLGVRLAATATPPLVMVVVPIGELDDASTRTLYFDQTEIRTYGVRRIHSLNGGATMPTGVTIDLLTE